MTNSFGITPLENSDLSSFYKYIYVNILYLSSSYLNILFPFQEKTSCIQNACSISGTTAETGFHWVHPLNKLSLNSLWWYKGFASRNMFWSTWRASDGIVLAMTLWFFVTLSKNGYGRRLGKSQIYKTYTEFIFFRFVMQKKEVGFLSLEIQIHRVALCYNQALQLYIDEAAQLLTLSLLSIMQLLQNRKRPGKLRWLQTTVTGMGWSVGSLLVPVSN